jgi:hypothetical protein
MGRVKSKHVPGTEARGGQKRAANRERRTEPESIRTEKCRPREKPLIGTEQWRWGIAGADSMANVAGGMESTDDGEEGRERASGNTTAGNQ